MNTIRIITDPNTHHQTLLVNDVVIARTGKAGTALSVTQSTLQAMAAQLCAAFGSKPELVEYHCESGTHFTSNDEHQLGFHSALAMIVDEPELDLYEAEILVVNANEDPSTGHDSFTVYVAADSAQAAKLIAVEFAEESDSDQIVSRRGPGDHFVCDMLPMRLPPESYAAF